MIMAPPGPSPQERESLSAAFDRAQLRSEEFGRLGRVLFGILKSNVNSLWFLVNIPFPQQLAKLELHSYQLSAASPLLSAAVSLLLFDYPLQLTENAALTQALLNATFPGMHELARPRVQKILKNTTNPTSYGAYAWRLCKDKALRDAAYPLKPHPGAKTKPMVRFGPLLRSLITIVGSDEAGRWVAMMEPGTPRDVVASHIIYSFALRPHLSAAAPIVSASCILDPKSAKGLSNALKALGLNATPFGACLTETQVLQGRLTGAVDWDDEMAKRTDADVVANIVVKCSAEELRPHVRAVLDDELPKGFTLPELDDFWTSRWSWCVNGSHTTESSRLLDIPRDAMPEFPRLYRRMASEWLEDEPISTWDGTTSVSASEKLEHGKTRAIYACDTRSYFAWSWPLNAVQKAWKNRRVLLDPGRGGMSAIGSKIGLSKRTPGVNLMLDFDDFNSHHSTEIMQMVTEELMSRSNSPPWLVETLVASLDREYIKRGKDKLHVKGTLMSGHRGTTFFNSVLNAALIRKSAGADLYDRIYSLHTGDDVYARVPSFTDVETILRGAESIGCRLNPTKQSIGFKHAEFLRCAFSGEGGYGYVARSVATCVSGSWTNTDPLGVRESLTNAIAVCRSLINRSGQAAFPRLLGPALRVPRGVSFRQSIELLAGGLASLDNSPVFNTAHRFPVYTLSAAPQRPKQNLDGLPHKATSQYLTKHASEVEIEALCLARVDPQPLMVASSFSKGLTEGITDPPPMDVKFSHYYQARRAGLASDAQSGVMREGALNKYPIIHLLADRLNNSQLRQLLLMVGVSPSDNPRIDAFGADSHPALIHGTLPFSDAAAIAKATGYDLIYVTYPINM